MNKICTAKGDRFDRWSSWWSINVLLEVRFKNKKKGWCSATITSIMNRVDGKMLLKTRGHNNAKWVSKARWKASVVGCRSIKRNDWTRQWATLSRRKSRPSKFWLNYSGTVLCKKRVKKTISTWAKQCGSAPSETLVASRCRAQQSQTRFVFRKSDFNFR